MPWFMMCSIIATLVARYKAGLLVENAPWHEISRFHVAEGAKVPACQAATAALPSHFGGIAPFFHCPAINRARAGGSLPGSVPMSSFVPIVMVSGRSVLSRRVRHGTPRTVVFHSNS